MKNLLCFPRQVKQIFFPLRQSVIYLPVNKTCLNAQRFDRPAPDPLALALLEEYESIFVSESPQSPPQTAPPTHPRDIR